MIISRTDTVAANTRSPNVFAGEQFEFMPARALIKMRASATATGIRADVQIGGVTIASNALVSESNRFPIVPDDNLADFGGMPGERLFATYLNTTGASITIKTVVEILPY